MSKTDSAVYRIRGAFGLVVLAGWVLLAGSVSNSRAEGPPPAPVRVAEVKSRLVSKQIALIGTVEAVAVSLVATEVSGLVEAFPLHAGDFVEKNAVLARLKSADLEIRRKGAVAGRERIRARLLLAEKELQRVTRLSETNSIAQTQYDEALHNFEALSHELRSSEAELEHLEYQLGRKTVRAPFAGFIAEEHTEVGEWINPGGAVVTLMNLEELWVTVDVPERYVPLLSPGNRVAVEVKSVSGDRMPGEIYAVLPQGNSDSRSFPVRIKMRNPDYTIKCGMEAVVHFDLASQKEALLVPKDAVVTGGTDRLVYRVAEGKALPVTVTVVGYYGGDVAVEGGLQPGEPVVIRGNERLRPGQPVRIAE